MSISYTFPFPLSPALLLPRPIRLQSNHAGPIPTL